MEEEEGKPETKDVVMSEPEEVQQLRMKVESIVDDMIQRLEYRERERCLNDKDKIVYPEESFFVKLDSNIKKNTAFVKKLKTNLTEGQRDVLLKEFNSLNLSRYITEVTSSLVEAKIKMSDLSLVLQLCSELHRRYQEFSECLLDAFLRILPRKPADLSGLNVSKSRTDLRFFADLISYGILTLKQGIPILGQVITLLIQVDKESHQHLATLLSFVKNCSEDFLGVVPRSLRLEAEKVSIILPRSTLLSMDRQRNINALMKEYLQSLIKHAFKEHSDLMILGKQNRKILMNRGELPVDRREQYEQLSASFQRLVSSATQFADLIDEDFPELPQDLPDASNDFEMESTSSLDISNKLSTTSDPFGPNSLWEDEDTMNFYTSLIDVKSLIPSNLYKDSCKDGIKEEGTSEGQHQQESVCENSKNNETEKMVTDDQEDIDMEAVMAEAVTPVEIIDAEEADSSDLPVSLLTTDSEASATNCESKGSLVSGVTCTASSSPSSLPFPSLSNASPATKSMNKSLMDAFTSSLLSCVNRDMIDKAAINFCTNLNTKNNRNKLIRFLFSVPRNRLDLLPFYARLVKTLVPVMPHISSELIDLLKQDFRYHVKKKDQINIEAKIKSVRFIGEMVKFELYSKADALFCLKMLLHDFSHHQIDMTCAFLESCGRFLFRSPTSHPRMTSLLEQMMRKKVLLPYDSRTTTMIENAYYSTNPTDSGTSIFRVERPPIQEYIRKLIYTDLDRRTVLIVMKQLRKFDWKDQEIVDYIIKTLISVWNVKFTNIRFLANLLSALKRFNNFAVIQVVDGVLEDIRLMMEVNQPKFNQRRIAIVKFLGELYNYRVVDSVVIFQELYSLITFGSGTGLDVPPHLFRIRLVCQLLDSCGVYFASHATKRKLDCFLIYFQQYYWNKKSQPCFTDTSPFPVTVDILFTETVKNLRNKFKFAVSLEEANEAVIDLMKQLQPKVIELFPQLKEQIFGKEVPSPTNDLTAIPEEVEEDSNTDKNTQEEEDDMDDDEDDEAEDEEDKKEEEEDVEDDSGSSSSDREDMEFPEEEPKIIAKPKYVPCPEDDMFAKEFEKLVSNSLQSRSKHEVNKSHTEDIVIPIDAGHEVKATSIKSRILSTSSGDENGVEEEEEEETIDLKVMTRPSKGAKPVLKVLHVPVDSDVAIALRETGEKEKKEREQFKKLTLGMNDRIDEQETSVVTNASNQYYSRKKYYSHPKGAPDADLIFGSSNSTAQTNVASNRNPKR